MSPQEVVRRLVKRLLGWLYRDRQRKRKKDWFRRFNSRGGCLPAGCGSPLTYESKPGESAPHQSRNGPVLVRRLVSFFTGYLRQTPTRLSHGLRNEKNCNRFARKNSDSTNPGRFEKCPTPVPPDPFAWFWLEREVAYQVVCPHLHYKKRSQTLPCLQTAVCQVAEVETTPSFHVHKRSQRGCLTDSHTAGQVWWYCESLRDSRMWLSKVPLSCKRKFFRCSVFRRKMSVATVLCLWYLEYWRSKPFWTTLWNLGTWLTRCLRWFLFWAILIPCRGWKAHIVRINFGLFSCRMFLKCFYRVESKIKVKSPLQKKLTTFFIPLLPQSVSLQRQRPCIFRPSNCFFVCKDISDTLDQSCTYRIK